MSTEKKRKLGQFYTPTLFVDYAHNMLSKQFGEDWKEKYVVWDNCSGTKNLTRDYYFKELYSSTLENAELQISERYNREGTAFQFDFLNDSLDKLPQGLKNALENNKPIIFFINPPYASACNGGAKSGNKTDAIISEVSKKMKEDNVNGETQNLYTQFLYRIMMIKREYNLTNCHIALFSPTLFITGGSFKKFRNVFLTDFAFINAVQFKASHFADVADSWGISFSIWNNGETADKNNFNYTLIDNIDGEIKEIGEKVVYNIDGEISASKWVVEDIKHLKRDDAPQLSSAINCKEKGYGTIVKNSFGSFVNNANSVDSNTQNVTMLSSTYSGFANVSILPINFDKCTALFSARRLVSCNWVNWADEYLAPNTESEKYQEFVNDSIIYSLFESKSNQSSLRQVEYKGKLWDIKNEFFFMSKEEIMSLANENGFDFTYNDAKVSSERYVYTKLQGVELSAEAKAVLDKAIELTKASFKYRELFNEEHSEYQIMVWDAGFYQLKAMWKEFMPNEYKEFTELFKKLADKMRPMVYELNFLK